MSVVCNSNAVSKQICPPALLGSTLSVQFPLHVGTCATTVSRLLTSRTTGDSGSFLDYVVGYGSFAFPVTNQNFGGSIYALAICNTNMCNAGMAAIATPTQFCLRDASGIAFAPAPPVPVPQLVSLTLLLSGISPGAFTSTAAAAGIASAAGVSAADVSVTVTDLTVDTLLSLAGVDANSLTYEQLSSLLTVLVADLPDGANVTVSSPQPVVRRRRLLDAVVPVSVAHLGGDPSKAQLVAATLASGTKLQAAAHAVGAAGATASAPIVSATLHVSVRTASADAAGPVTAALSDSNMAALASAFTAAGVANTGVAVTVVLATSPQPAPAAGATSVRSAAGAVGAAALFAMALL